MILSVEPALLRPCRLTIQLTNSDYKAIFMFNCRILLASFLMLLPSLQGQTGPFDPFEATIPQMRAVLDSGAITCRQLVQFYMDRMDAYETGGPKRNAIRVQNAQAFAIADSYDKQSRSVAVAHCFAFRYLLKTI